MPLPYLPAEQEALTKPAKQLTYEDICLLIGMMDLFIEGENPSPLRNKLTSIANETQP